MTVGLTPFERIDRVILPVPNVRQAAEWYVAEFELRMTRIGRKEIDLQIQEGEAVLTLTESPGQWKFKPLVHLDADGHVPCFNFYTHWEDLHREWLQSRGIGTTELMQTPYMNVCEMTDPYGNVVGLCHEKSDSLFYTPSPGPVPPMLHHVLAVFIPVRDVDSSIRWYTEVLGFELVQHWGEGADLKIGEGETIVTLIGMGEELHRTAIHDLGGRAYYSLQSSNIQESYRQLDLLGVTAGPCRDQDGVRMFEVKTPEGCLIRISEKELISVG